VFIVVVFLCCRKITKIHVQNTAVFLTTVYMAANLSVNIFEFLDIFKILI